MRLRFLIGRINITNQERVPLSKLGAMASQFSYLISLLAMSVILVESPEASVQDRTFKILDIVLLTPTRASETGSGSIFARNRRIGIT
jgi:hypothetical protein